VNCAVTYALSLYAAGRTAEGLQILRQLPPEEFEEPHAAVYAATLYLDENQLELAKPYIAAAQKAPLFAEEKKLLDEAVAKAALISAAAPPQPMSPTPADPPSRPETSPSPSQPEPSPARR